MKVHWTNRALAHLFAIYEYISKDSSYYAKKMVDKLTRRTEMLGDFPKMGGLYPSINQMKSEKSLKQVIGLFIALNQKG